MRKAVLLATVMAFAGADVALAAPAPFASTGKAVISNAGQDLTLVRRRKRKARVVRQRTTTEPGTMVAPGGATTVAPGRGGAAAPSRMNSANPSAAPSGQNPAVDQGMRTPRP